MVTKKDYQSIAAVIAIEHKRASEAAELEPEGFNEVTTVENIMEGLASVFEADNPRFDKARFLIACKAVI